MSKPKKQVDPFMLSLLKQTNGIPIFYKYLTYSSAKLMLEHHNIQFTRGDGLNDPRDLDICKCDMSVIEELSTKLKIPEHIIIPRIQQQAKWIKSIGVCSLGQSRENPALWKEYACSKNWLGLKRETGICIGLDQDLLIHDLVSQEHLISALLVDYVHNVAQTIPWELSFGTQKEVWQFLVKIYATKDLKWQEEKEVRLVYAESLDEKYKRIPLDKSCFKYVIFGKDVNRKNKSELEKIISTYPNIQVIDR